MRHMLYTIIDESTFSVCSCADRHVELMKIHTIAHIVLLQIRVYWLLAEIVPHTS